MNSEILKNFFKDKREAFQIGVKNLQARNELNNLLERGAFISEIKYYREGESIFLGQRLKLRGYCPEDNLFDNIKKIEGSAEIKISVKGNGFFEKVSILKRK